MKRGWTIGGKMTAAIALVVSVGILLLILVAETQVRTALVDKERAANEVISGFLAQDIGAALRFRKADKIDEAFAALAGQKGAALLLMTAYDGEGKVIAAHGDAALQGQGNAALLRERAGDLAAGRTVLRVTDEVLDFVLPVTQGKDAQVVGSLGVVWSLEPVNRQVADLLRGGLLMTVGIVLLIVAVLILCVRLLVVQPIARIVALGRELARGEGDLRQRINYGRQDELRLLCDTFNDFIDKVHQTITEVTSQSEGLTAIATQSLGTAESTNAAIQEQRRRLEQMATAATEMSSSIRIVAENALQAERSSQEARQTSSRGQKIIHENRASIALLAEEVDRASTAIRKVSEDSQQIGTIVEVIRGIAEQTNLLALNAAIEAARAGEQGRGFAVVADEVRTLASKTQRSTEEIKSMIERLQQGSLEASRVMEDGRVKAQQGVEQAGHTSAALDQIDAAVDAIAQVNGEIVQATQAQAQTAEEISTDINEVSDLCQSSAGNAAAAARQGAELFELLSRTQRTLGKFKV